MSLSEKLLAGLSGVLVLVLLVLGSMLYRAESKLAQVQTKAVKLDTAVQAQGAVSYTHLTLPTILLV